MIRHWHHLLAAALLCAGALTVALPAAAQNVSMEFHWRGQPAARGRRDCGRPPRSTKSSCCAAPTAKRSRPRSRTRSGRWMPSPTWCSASACAASTAEGNASRFSEWSDPVYFESQGAQDRARSRRRPNWSRTTPIRSTPRRASSTACPTTWASGEPMRLEIFTVDGRRVRTFDDRPQRRLARSDLGRPRRPGPALVRRHVHHPLRRRCDGQDRQNDDG